MSEFDVLVVEDEPIVIRATRRVLEREGLGTDQALDPTEALAKLRSNGYRALLVDLMLPGVTGFELVKEAVAAAPATPLIVITGYSTDRKAVEAFQAGAFDFLPKPFDVEELLGTVRRALGLGGRGRAMAGPAALEERRPLRRGTGAGAERLFFLGAHSWARPRADGTATLGVAETFVGLGREIERIELPAAGESVSQGGGLARFVTRDGGAHRVWSPLSGRVLEASAEGPRLRERIDEDPFGRGWLARIAPSGSGTELEELEFR